MRGATSFWWTLVAMSARRAQGVIELMEVGVRKAGLMRVGDLSCKAEPQAAVVHARLTSEIKTLAEEWQPRASWRAHYATP